MSLLELKIKPPKVEQLSQVVELDQLCFGGLWTREGYQRELTSSNSRLLVLSIESIQANCLLSHLSIPSSAFSSISSATIPASREELIIGCGCFWQILEEAHITLLAIHPDYQSQGLGQLLLYALLKDAWKRKLERATLEVRPSNQIALSLYQKFGFKIAGRRKGYYQNTGEDALVLWRGDLAKLEFQENLTDWQQTIEKKLLKHGFIVACPDQSCRLPKSR